VAAGFTKLGEIVPQALEVVASDYDVEALRPHAQRVLAEA
jgi:hypothetical protein